MENVSEAAIDNDEERVRVKAVDSQWNLSTLSMIAPLEEEESGLFPQQAQTNLQLIKELEIKSDLPSIPATMQERLSYFRAYTSSICKTEILCMQQLNFNKFFWNYIINVFGKSLPISYIYTCIAGYVPDCPMYLPRMVPLSCGAIFLYMIAGLMDVIIFCDHCLMVLDYVFHGIIYNNPWNRCDSNSTRLETNITVNCYTLEDFAVKCSNASCKFDLRYYVTSTKEQFQVAPVIFFSKRSSRLYSNQSWLFALYYVLILSVCILIHKQLFKVYVWKVSHKVQYLINVVYVLVYFHLVFAHQDRIEKNIPEIEIPVTPALEVFWSIDIDILAESIIAPPILHIVTARSTRDVKPGRDTAMVVISNALYYIFSGSLVFKLKRHCDAVAKSSIFITPFNQYQFFYLWPIYFSTFHFGNLYCIIFLFLTFILEFITLGITYQCLVEVIVCSWRRIPRLLVSCLIAFVTLPIVTFVPHTNRFIIFMYTKNIITLLEIIFLFYLYPFDRLIDDIKFHFGSEPSKIWIINMKLAPIFYFIKFYHMTHILSSFLKKHLTFIYVKLLHINVYVLVMTTVCLCFGIAFSIYTIKFKLKKGWQLIFCPVADWGPKDPKTRRLRKQYDSRTYIGSQAPRELSRYMIRKAESKVYRIDVRYN